MNELHKLIKQLDSLSNNTSRKEFLNSIQRNPELSRHHLRRLACNILVQENFVDKYYRENFGEMLKKLFSKIISIFKESLKR
ncbi:hypothetical protein [Chryseobacterium turcicum]|uniref:Uncharacterized protein n=1 Tax=Chryseobacterium turcicum TaxID=2898076 RepID=A0A9Q3YY89_9FLAO|nr:hypothetical protein [Chryseobacterium turcicum]MCD1118212.1 hypothetical protein [Chryseobacterium turcicum]